MIAQTIIDAVVQLILFSIIPLLWWFFSARKKESLWSWVGLISPKFSDKSKAVIILLLSLTFLLVPGLHLLFALEDRYVLASARFAGLGLSGIIPVLVYAIIQTGLSEEIFFRGFINKRLCNKFGFTVGNSVQAILFGLVHGIILFSLNPDVLFVVLVTIFSAVAGWLMGYMNEKIGNGSIAPSWIIHSFVNVISSVLILPGIIVI